MILSVANDGRLLQNTMREFGKKVKKSVHLQAFVCAGIAQTMKRPVVLAFQHTLNSDYPLNYDVPSEWVFPSQSKCESSDQVLCQGSSQTGVRLLWHCHVWLRNAYH